MENHEKDLEQLTKEVNDEHVYSSLYGKVQDLSEKEKKEMLYEKYPHEDVLDKLSERESMLLEDFNAYMKLNDDSLDVFGARVMKTFRADYGKKLGESFFNVEQDTDNAKSKVTEAIYLKKMEKAKQKRQEQSKHNQPSFRDAYNNDGPSL